MEKRTLLSVMLTALFAALAAVGAFIRIPLPPVPVTLQTLFALVAGLVLPLRLSLGSMLAYLFIGLIGLPIFTTGGGIAAIAGPTGGYLAGLVAAVIVEAIVLRLVPRKNMATYLLAALLATMAIYIPGLLWLKSSLSLSWSATFISGLVPFILGDVLKLIASAFVATRVAPRVEMLLATSDGDED